MQMLQDACVDSGQEVLPQCRCQCCTERLQSHSQSSIVGEAIEMRVHSMRWRLGRGQDRTILCGDELSTRRLKDLPRAVKMAAAVVRPSFMTPS